MAGRFASLTTVLLLAAICGFGQIIIPGVGYPGGGYPGRRYPQGGQPPMRQPDNPASLQVGMLRKIEDKDVVIESDDQTITTISISGSTKYVSASGGSAKIGDFQPGDHVSISATQDSKHAYHASKMTMVTEGTAEEHSTASLATNDISHPITKGSSSSASSSGSSGGDRPTLHRASGSEDTGSSGTGSSGTPLSTNDNGRPTLHRATPSLDDGSSTASSNSSSSDDDRPRLRRADSNSDAASSSRNSSNTASNYPTSSNNDAPPPRMRRAVSSADDDTLGANITPVAPPPPPPANPAPSPSLARSTDNSDRPQLRRAGSDDDTASVASRMPQRMPATGDPVIDQAREAAFAFSETLPNYVVKQYTTRYATFATRGGRTNWQTLDVVSADVIEEDGNEKYKNILVNGKPPVQDIEKTGSWSRGEFSSMLQEVLSPLTNADFHGKRTATILNRAAYRYDFTVEQPNSHWHVAVEERSYMPGYSGSIWIDKENYRTLRIEMSAEHMPTSFALDQVEWAVDYDYVFIGEGKYLLPVHSEALSCARATNQCTRNVIEFRNYKKFTADTSITFDTDK
jgi:hypothetical protein